MDDINFTELKAPPIRNKVLATVEFAIRGFVKLVFNITNMGNLFKFKLYCLY